MPHQCVKCNAIYEDAANEILKGCSKCGGKFFFFVRKESLDKVRKAAASLSTEDKVKMEQDVREIIGDYSEDDAVVLDMESVNMSEPGKFELDLVKLFKGDPVVYKLDEGKYIIDVATTFKNFNEGKKKKK
jgi:predicted  nucleic acid-binding Zn-ribbon protein